MITLAGPKTAAETIAQMAAALELEEQAVTQVIGADLAEAAGIAETEILVTILAPCGPPQFAAMPRLRGIVSPLQGFEWIDLAEATRRGIPVVNGDVAENRESMAEATILLVLAQLYRLHDTEQEFRDPTAPPSGPRRMLRTRTVGVIGYGGIAQEIVRLLEPWGCEVLVSTRTSVGLPPHAARTSLENLLERSDVILVMTSLDASTRHLINRQTLQLAKPGAYLVNTARGGLIDEQALEEALRAGRIAGAALDVFEIEPLPLDHPFRSLPNLILTNHRIGHTAESREAVPHRGVELALELAAGRVPKSCKNPEFATRGA